MNALIITNMQKITAPLHHLSHGASWCMVQKGTFPLHHRTISPRRGDGVVQGALSEPQNKSVIFCKGYNVQKIVAIGENGLRIGEDHPRAKLSNHDVDRLLELRDEGWSYTRLSEAFEISRRGVRDICTGRRRCQTPVAFRVVRIPDDEAGENS
jgi:hypothetical protein